MTVLDTNVLIDILRGRSSSEVTVDLIHDPKTTTINVFELYFGARLSAKRDENISNINSLLKSIEILDFDIPAALKAADIHARLMSSGKQLDTQDVLIAGIVVANNEELITKDTDHFSRIPDLRCRSWKPGDYGR